MTALSTERIDAFRTGFGGQVLTPGHPDYDRSRAVWNGAIDRKPALIASCTTSEQVGASIRFARTQGLQIAVRGGGHSYAGNSVCDGGLMIHLGAMNRVVVDATARRAVCGGGTTWADVDAATQAHGLATPGGFISHTGIAGLTLGGGIGWLTNKAGLSCDNLISAEVVTADSRIVHASANENPELYWALRGGGGNFGVVTSFEFALHPVGPMVHLGLFFFGLETGQAALRFAREFVKTLPGEATAFLAIGLSAPPAPFVPEAYHFRPGHALLVVGFETAEAHQALVAPIRDAVTPLFDMVTPIPYVALQQMFNDSAAWGTRGYEKALYLDHLSDEAIAVIGEHVPKKRSPHSFCPTFTLAGAYRSPGDADTAFGGSRNAGYVFNIEAAAADRETYEADRAWVRNFWEAMRPHATGSGGYVNFMVEADEDRVRASYGEAKYQRLAAIKAQHDPGNIFNLNANIKPSPGSAQ
ncbi:FAD-binding oxidoreductase [Variovorax sp. GT1P44]|uniref:FAD-binding oxidoreductase n=1 Tax=Variovorax sp. GT1P44 TaxID=3443742 RepID=UPI003F44A44E